jgi:hypothetical protein
MTLKEQIAELKTQRDWWKAKWESCAATAEERRLHLLALGYRETPAGLVREESR